MNDIEIFNYISQSSSFLISFFSLFICFFLLCFECVKGQIMIYRSVATRKQTLSITKHKLVFYWIPWMNQLHIDLTIYLLIIVLIFIMINFPSVVWIYKLERWFCSTSGKFKMFFLWYLCVSVHVRKGSQLDPLIRGPQQMKYHNYCC